LRVAHEVVRPAESRAAADEEALLRVEVPGDGPEVFDALCGALAGDDRGGKDGIRANHYPRVDVVAEVLGAG